MKVALLSDVFFTPDGESRLRRRLADAKSQGADLVVLPEIPLNPWSPATDMARDEDAEPPAGPRHRILSGCARDAGVGVVGGAIVIDPATGRRHNTALVFDQAGALVATYRKVHLPDEEGFREPCHYQPGTDPPAVIRAFPLPFGIQICSDMNRPEGSHVLGAMGAVAIVNPRATQAATFDRWKLVFRANALTSTAYVLSVNRPGPEQGVSIGGSSVVVDPNGEVLLESSDALVVAELDQRAIEDARRRYPGYLSHYPELYARGWRKVPSGLTREDELLTS
jgi:predicted amidohydrolase